MRLPNILLKTLRDQRLQVAGYGIALASIAALDVYIWPSYRNTFVNFEVPPALEALFGGELNLATAAGFLSAEFYFVGEHLAARLRHHAGHRSHRRRGERRHHGPAARPAGHPPRRRPAEGRGRLPQPHRHHRDGYVGWLIPIPFVDIEVSLWDVFLGNVNLPMSLLFFALSLYAGAVLPTRSAAVGLVVGLAVAAYFAQTVTAIVGGLSWIEYLTPFYYYGAGAPLVDGMNWWHIALLLGPAALLLAMTLRTFDRRDVSAGGAVDLGLSGVMRRIAAVRSGV